MKKKCIADSDKEVKRRKDREDCVQDAFYVSINVFLLKKKDSKMIVYGWWNQKWRFELF